MPCWPFRRQDGALAEGCVRFWDDLRGSQTNGSFARYRERFHGGDRRGWGSVRVSSKNRDFGVVIIVVFESHLLS